MSDLGEACPTCGRPRHDVVVAATEATVENPRSSRAVGYAALLLIPVAIAATLVLSDGDDDAPVDAPSTTLPGTDELGGDSATTAAESAVEDSAETVGAPGVRIAYAGSEGVVIIDPETSRSDVIELSLRSPEVAYDAPFVLVTDEQRTLAIHPSFPDDPLALASNYRLVPTSASGQFVFRPADPDAAERGEVFVGHAADGSFGPRQSIPAGTEQLAVPGLGLLLVGPDGTTFRVGFLGFEPVSAFPVVAATPTHRLELRCAGELVCASVLVANGSGIETTVPDAVATAWVAPVPSSDGAWVLSGGTAAAVLHDTETWEAVELAAGPLLASAAWAPDASFVAMIDGPAAAPGLRLRYLDGREDLIVDLPGDAVTGPIESNVVITQPG